MIINLKQKYQKKFKGRAEVIILNNKKKKTDEKLIDKKGEGAFSEVLLAQSLKTGTYVAIKCMKNHFESIEQVNNFVEIQALRKLSPHPHIIKLLEALYDEPTGRLALVFELMDMNLYEAIKGRKSYLPEAKVKSWMYQLIVAVEHMHKKGVFHRDIKPENILLRDDLVKLADFGSCRGTNTKAPYTEYISTRWYRAPECLLTDGYYNCQMDMWGIGCVFFEMLSLYPLFPGEKNEIDQIQMIFKVMGSPNQALLDKWKKQATHVNFEFHNLGKAKSLTKMLSHVSIECVDLISQLLKYNPEERLTATQARNHGYFKDIREQTKKKFRPSNPMKRRDRAENSYDKYRKNRSNYSSDSSVGSNHRSQISYINININANSNQNSNMNVNINLKGKKRKKFKQASNVEKAHYYKNTQISDESDVDLPLIMQKKDYIKKIQKYQQRKKKYGGNEHSSSNISNVGKIGISKMINEHKRHYVSPYSQKIIKNHQ